MLNRQSLSRLSLSALTVVGLLLLAGCGQWVRYDGNQNTAGNSNTVVGLENAARLNHLSLAGPLGLYVKETQDGSWVVVDYDGWRADPEALHLLDDYLATIATINPSVLANTEERLAYWINGYNASVIRGVLDRYDGDHGYQVIGGTFFDEAIYSFGSVPMSLNQVEHGVLRGDLDDPSVVTLDAGTRARIDLWNDELWAGRSLDPRIHAVINCAALGCPNMLAVHPFVYRADLLEDQLEDATRAWLDNESKGAGPHGISQLFEWFADDFTAGSGSVEAFIEEHRSAGLDGVDLSRFIPYDWTLNIYDGEQ